jgi:hypothetical protein
VLRFPGRQAENEMHQVLEILDSVLQQRCPPINPLPSPSGRGAGGEGEPKTN